MSHRQRGSLGPGSLNFNLRKRENDRIERENHKFAQRLFESKGVLNKKNLDVSFREQERYKNQIQKVRPVRYRLFGETSMMSKTNQLPPLKGSHTTSNSMLEVKNQA